ncbi:DinB family protein [Marinomonas pollencensis]|uniref:Putative damage-inducible protein DinB n=1 Tax=Marinomonas pollencensis TaxID=491954 RepID=A0A3E0DA80_9GAMM|nr:DinB family protein [Marinomonas pollencensis]REG79433.1 putative damage-inducible protein DinB [Marinomonas pollencensis]
MSLNSSKVLTHKALHENAIVAGCLESLEQGRQFLKSINDEQYCYLASPHVTSSIGEHFRHLLDVFYSIYRRTDFIDYNLRRRGHALETSRAAALVTIVELTQWLQVFTDESLDTPISVLAEVSLSHAQTCEMESTLGRELTFASLHATHHFAMAKVVVSLLNVKVAGRFGYAPATVTYFREQ